VPLCWLAMLPLASLPASIRAQLSGRVDSNVPAATVVPLAAGVPAAVRDAPAALSVPESTSPAAMVGTEEAPPPQDLSRTVGSFGSATSAGSFSAFFAPDFQLGPNLNNGM
jgi:hypothetical protein